jgi:hypothetical protein
MSQVEVLSLEIFVLFFVSQEFSKNIDKTTKIIFFIRKFLEINLKTLYKKYF